MIKNYELYKTDNNFKYFSHIGELLTALKIIYLIMQITNNLLNKLQCP